ncbi:hypothetical protein AXG93_1862s1410 [Marchantia polymorpha subsp. ruderalis]|uniref:Uncharacterized protein n=1 Tax=Marchantia polymorpha subsp. ruderalis TaxID=1480154 RepID=A0A176W941_MARPO|nr:hypothetical protein AXG93_1862s1410 [Marchantia polymorpha subsp. ruderalis]
MPSADTCAFGGTEHLQEERLRRDKTKQHCRQDALTSVNAFDGSAFGDAPSLTDTFKGTPSALRKSDFGGRQTPSAMRREKNRESARGKVLCRHAFGAARARLSRRTTAEIKFNSRASTIAQQEIGGETSERVATSGELQDSVQQLSAQLEGSG